MTRKLSGYSKCVALTDCPQWNDRIDHCKSQPIGEPVAPPDYVVSFLEHARSARGATTGNARVLDIGCGRGDTVASLLARGWDAWGVDVNEQYVEIGRRYLRQQGHDPARLQVGDPYPLDDGAFDLIFSDQVIEHVPALDPFASEVARVSAPAAIGLHIFPARWRPIEPHLGMPFVHWVPKGRPRHLAIHAEVNLGLAPNAFSELTPSERATVLTTFSETETFYRSPAEVASVFERHRIETDIRDASVDKVRHELEPNRLPRLLARPAGFLYRHAFSVVLHTRQL
jgi:SAM-dependent methyltransferase